MIKSNCNVPDLEYNWVVRRSDSKQVAMPIKGLEGENPIEVDFSDLGKGVYYVFLEVKSKQGQMADFISEMPLEFVVPGSGIGSILTCEPKLNDKHINLKLSVNDPNPKVTANCSPTATAYYWTARKNGKDFAVPGVNGSESNPNFTLLGPGEYQLQLYATLNGSTHWRSSEPLTVKVEEGVSEQKSAIMCNPVINETLKEINLIGSSPHPVIQANCDAVNLTYNWTVIKGGRSIKVPGLSEAYATAEFADLGIGLYQVYLNVTGTNLLPWSSSKPLLVSVEGSRSDKTLQCRPKIDSKYTRLVIEDDRKKIALSSACNVNGAKTSWTAFHDDKPIEIKNFDTQNPIIELENLTDGDYHFYASASLDGYNSFQSSIPLTLNLKRKTKHSNQKKVEKKITADRNKVDILLVIDDSKSMAADNKKLAGALDKFVLELKKSKIDWQMCATVTRWQDDNPEKKPYWGLSRMWSNHIGNPQWLLNSGANNLSSIFTDTISAIGSGWENSDDERGIKSAWHHLEYAEYNKCYRDEAALVVLLISDEDVRSVGGDPSFAYYDGETKNLETEDLANSYLTLLRKKFGIQKRFTFNSIIVKPGDEKCMQLQDKEENSKSHYGFKYDEFSQMTDGKSAGICKSDYAQTLSEVKDRILRTAAAVNLECTPVGKIKAEVRPSMGTFNMNLAKRKLVFNPPIPFGRHLLLEYNCAAE